MEIKDFEKLVDLIVEERNKEDERYVKIPNNDFLERGLSIGKSNGLNAALSIINEYYRKQILGD